MECAEIVVLRRLVMFTIRKLYQPPLYYITHSLHSRAAGIFSVFLKIFKKIHFFLDSNENCCTFAVFYLTNTLTQNTTI